MATRKLSVTNDKSLTDNQKSLQIINQQNVLGKDFKVYGDFENPLFLAKDVAEWIEYSKTKEGFYQVSAMLSSVDEDEKLTINILNSDGKAHNQSFLTENGLYEVLMLSKKPIAKQFKKEVKRILHEIRTKGSFSVPRSFAEALQLAADQQKKIEEQQMAIEQSKPKVEFFDKVTGSSDTCDMKEVAKILNFKGIGRNNLFEILRNENILDKQNQPYQKYVDAGYFRVIESKWEDKDGDIHINLKTVVFQKGVDFIRKTVLKSNSYLSNEKVIKDTADNWISENEKIEYLDFSDVLNKTGLYRTAVLDFLVLRGYLKKDSIWYDVTLLGKEKGVKMEEGELFLSSNLVERISSVFNFKTDLSVKKQGEILRILKEAEKNMKSSSIGKAE